MDSHETERRETSRPFVPLPPPERETVYTESLKYLSKRLGSTFAPWLGFWCAVWLGTTLAGGLFGAVLCTIIGLSIEPGVIPYNPVALGLLYGLWGAGCVAGLIVPTFATLCWMFWQLKRPFVLAFLAGCLTGGICGVFLFFITGPLGGLGAVLAVRWYMRTKWGKSILQANEVRRHQKNRATRFSYTISDLFWRMTAVAALITVWSVVIRYWLQIF